MNKKIVLLSISVIALLSAFGIFAAHSKEQLFEQRRANLLNELSGEISLATLEGKYHCCIDPPCTMCYLGDWLWDDGTCDCDAMIANGEIDKVCPQCKKSIETGLCDSSTQEFCETKGEIQ